MQILEVSGEHRYLSSKRGFLIIKDGKDELGRVCLDNLLGVIGAGHGITVSQQLLARLAKRGIPYVICDNSFSPVAVAWPLQGHHRQSRVMQEQINAKTPFQKRMWQTLIRSKIGSQASVLEFAGGRIQNLKRLQMKVKSGDPENIEAQAARYYWPALMGKEFKRKRHGASPNDLLNYGYTVIRSAVSRAICAVGLHPSVSICHRNQFNQMVFVDDLIEPFRPFVDLRVRKMMLADMTLDTKSKQLLVELLHLECGGAGGVKSLLRHIQIFSRSVADSYLERAIDIKLPSPTKLDWAAFANL